MKHEAKGVVKIVGASGVKEVTCLRKLSKLLRGDGIEQVVEFAVHVHPQDQKTLVISEVSTGHDTQLRILHPKTHQPMDVYQLSKFTAGQLRRLAQSALHTGLARIGHQRFLDALARAHLEQMASQAKDLQAKQRGTANADG